MKWNYLGNILVYNLYDYISLNKLILQLYVLLCVLYSERCAVGSAMNLSKTSQNKIYKYKYHKNV